MDLRLYNYVVLQGTGTSFVREGTRFSLHKGLTKVLPHRSAIRRWTLARVHSAQHNYGRLSWFCVVFSQFLYVSAHMLRCA